MTSLVEQVVIRLENGGRCGCRAMNSFLVGT